MGNAAPPQSRPQADMRTTNSPPQTVALDLKEYMRQLIQEMLDSSLILADDWHQIPEAIQNRILQNRDEDSALNMLVEHKLLTAYQSDRIRAGTTYGLILGNYRVLERVGAGGMGIVFRGEHIMLRRSVAIKVLPLSRDQDVRILLRFKAEMRMIASLQHPNIVSATDAGQISSKEPNLPVLHYLVMEYVHGRDLEQIVERDGPIDPMLACEYIHQAASALSEAHHHNLVHRDIKPSNLMVTSKNQLKLLDFGLAHNFNHQLTEPGSLLGTLDYMSPEQAQDPRHVDIRSDIYALGGSLFWCLTGRVPFPAEKSLPQHLRRRLNEPPPSIRELKPDLPAELDVMVSKMMSVNPDERYQTPHALMRAIGPFLKSERASRLSLPNPEVADSIWALAESDSPDANLHRILAVDDEREIGTICQMALSDPSTQCDVVADADEAIQAAQRQRYDLILLDVVMPKKSGAELLPLLRAIPHCQRTRIVMMSGCVSADEMANLLVRGADDFISKPFSLVQLQTRIKAALALRDAQSRAELLGHHLKTISADLERNLEARDGILRQSRTAIVQMLCQLVQYRTNETTGHLQRVPRYCRILAQVAAKMPAFAGQINPAYVQAIERAAPLHDIGFISLPDHILQKPGKLDDDERLIMQSHAVIGAQLLQHVAEAYGGAASFLSTAVELVRSHHETYDGTGYPDRLVGEAIPLSARIMAIADVYDARRSRRSYRPALPHATTIQAILEGPVGRFDPNLLEAFATCAPEFERIYSDCPD